MGAALMHAVSAHGGPDGLGVPLHDFSTNANACGPCPVALHALAQADATHYPDPAYTALREALGALHGVAPDRVLMLASASEGMQRITAWVARSRGARVWLPPHHYGDTARAASAWGLARCTDAAEAALIWACEPSAPLGQAEAGLAARVAALGPGQVLVLDRAYEPLRLSGRCSLDADALDRVWQLWSPNKALGLTGVRAAYLIAPQGAQAAAEGLRACEPSWPVGAHGHAMLMAWTTAAAQAWLRESLTVLRQWKQRQQPVCEALGWAVLPSEANYQVVRPDDPLDGQALARLRRVHGLKLRDCASFGLPGHLRLRVAAPDAQAALAHSEPTRTEAAAPRSDNARPSCNRTQGDLLP